MPRILRRVERIDQHRRQRQPKGPKSLAAKYKSEIWLTTLLVLGIVLLLNPLTLFIPAPTYLPVGEVEEEPPFLNQLVNSVVDYVSSLRTRTTNSLADLLLWMRFRRGSEALGAVTLMGFLVTGAAYLRKRILLSPRFWQIRCPHCQQATLKRTHRSRADRFISHLGFPTRRYMCSNCSWEGLRIDESKL
jgi:predicted RNA-binding Zn-ribbon protein involved in translation (DUF1610 family)